MSDINYFHCKKIIEILKETEVDSKNLFGRYGSQRMKDWQEIVRLYERDNIYLAEAAQMLTRNVNFEVPSFKKQIQKLEQMETVIEPFSLLIASPFFSFIFNRSIFFFKFRTGIGEKRSGV